MKKELIIVLVLLLALASCTNSGGTVASNERTFLGGTTGLIIAFAEGEPPAEVTDGGENPFLVTIKLENEGEYEIAKEDITLSLKGFDPADFGVTSAVIAQVHPLEDILRNEINPDSGAAITSPPVYVTIPTTGELNFQNSLSGNNAFPFMVDVCYNYQTKATAPLCIKEDLLDSQNLDVCVVSGAKNVQNSGGPIQVVGFDEYTAGADKVTFTLTVKNIGNGKLSRASVSCDDAPIYENKLYLTVDAGMAGLTCTGMNGGVTVGTTGYGGEIRLTAGERQVRCTQPVLELIDKVKVVDVTIDYGYEESVSTNVLVKHIN